MIAAVLALVGCVAALVAFVFWQGKEVRDTRKSWQKLTVEVSELKILNAASLVAVSDKERVMNLLIAERDGLQAAILVVQEQRDALLEEAMANATPSSIAVSVRDALERLRSL